MGAGAGLADAPWLRVDAAASTMDLARERLEILPPPFWVSADRQTDGVGRRGRPWVMATGSLAATLCLVVDDRLRQTPAALSFCAALGLVGAVRECVPEIADRLALKWPNDLLLDGRKLAGILIQTDFAAEPAIAFVGIGVNIYPPVLQETPPPSVAPIALSQVAPGPPSVADLMGELQRHFAFAWARFLTDGFAPIRAAWLDLAAGRGEMIRAVGERRVDIGTFVGLGEDGSLLLRGVDGRIDAVAAADIFLGPENG